MKELTMVETSEIQRITLAALPLPAKALATCVILFLAVGMAGALAQVWVHDVIPTFFSQTQSMPPASQADTHKAGMEASPAPAPASPRGDLFADLKVKPSEPARPSLLDNQQFIWTLKWTHIHLFGMNMIFILMGAVTLMLNVSAKARTWLVVLPFAGVSLDIGAMWLKAFVSPVFFWLHLPGGGLFAAVFGYVSLRAMREMWTGSGSRQISRSVKSSS